MDRRHHYRVCRRRRAADADGTNRRRKSDDARTSSPRSWAWSLYAVIIATTVLLGRTVVHESRWWAVLIVTVSALPALFVTSITAWETLNEALSAPLRRVIAALSAGFLAYVAYRFGVSTVLICVGAFFVGLARRRVSGAPGHRRLAQPWGRIRPPVRTAPGRPCARPVCGFRAAPQCVCSRSPRSRESRSWRCLWSETTGGPTGYRPQRTRQARITAATAATSVTSAD